MSDKYPSVYWTLERYCLVYCYFSKEYPTNLLCLKLAYYALFSIVIVSCDLGLDIVFAAFTVSNLMLMYIWYINPDFSIKHPLLYRLYLTISLLIIVCSLIFFAHRGLTYIYKYYVYAKTPAEPAGGRPTGDGPRGSPEGPPGGDNPNPYIPQDSNTNKSQSENENDQPKKRRFKSGKYHGSELHKEAMRRYDSSDKGKESKKKYNKTVKGRERTIRYRQKMARERREARIASENEKNATTTKPSLQSAKGKAVSNSAPLENTAALENTAPLFDPLADNQPDPERDPRADPDWDFWVHKNNIQPDPDWDRILD